MSTTQYPYRSPFDPEPELEEDAMPFPEEDDSEDDEDFSTVDREGESWDEDEE